MVSNWIRLVKNNLVNSIGIFIIVLLTVFLGTIFLESNQNLNDYLNKLEKGNVEDFSFYPNVSSSDLKKVKNDYPKALNNKVKELSAKYKFDYEKVNYKVINENDKIFRLYSSKRTINQLSVEKGELPKQNQIGVDFNYAKENNIKVKDTLTIKGKDYIVSGICVFPDQLYPIVDNTGILYDKTSQAIIAFSQDDYAKIDTKENVYFAGTFLNKDNDTKAMESDSDYNFVTSSDENMQIYSSINSQKVMNIIIMSFSMGILGMITLLIIVITITRQIKSELPNLGVLKALGYNNRELSVKYLAYFFIIFIPAITGYLLGHIVTPNFYEIICSRFEIPYINNQINVINLIVFSVCPAVFAAIVGYITSVLCLRKPALNLIKEFNVSKNGRLIKRKNEKIKVDQYLKGVKNTLLYSNILLLIFVVFGGFALGVQIQFAYTTYNMTSNISDKVLDGMNYKSDVRYLNSIGDDLDKNNLYYYSKSGKFKFTSGETSSLYDIRAIGEGDEKLLELYDKKGDKINLSKEKGLIINQLMALQNNLKIGDKVEFVSGDEVIKTSISNITQSTYGTSIYMNQDLALKDKIISKVVYNGKYTNQLVPYDSDVHMSISNIDNIKETINQSNSLYVILSIMLFVFGLVVGATVLLLSIYGAITNYKKYIAIMKICGYTEKECSYTAIDGYRKVSLLGFLISIPYSFILCTVMFNIISKNSDMLYPVNFNIKSVAICFVLTLILTESIIMLTKKQISKISFKEIMEH